MAMRKLNYTVTVYKNTGFNGVDIPRTGAVLENATSQTYNDTYYLREDIDLPQISINDNYHNLADVDYVKLSTNGAIGREPEVFYYFATPSAGAGNTTILSLQLDALTTMGGASNLDYISGWQERGHIAKSDDVLFENVAPEDWSPSQPLKNSQYAYVDMTGGVAGITHPTDDLQIIITNIDLVELGKYVERDPVTGDITNFKNIIQTITGGDIDPTSQSVLDALMYLPKISSSKHHTTFQILAGTYEGTTATETASLFIPNTCAYDVTNDIVRNGLDLLFSCGQLQLQGSYTIPKEYIIATSSGNDMTYQYGDPDHPGTPSGRYAYITGNLSFATISNLPFEYVEGSYTPKNKKVFSMFRNVTLANPASGSLISAPVYELKKGNNTAPIVKTWSDPTSTGKPIAKFETDLSANVPFADTVSGSNWINNQLLMEGASGSLWNNVNAAINQQNLQRNNEQTKFNNLTALSQNNISQVQLEAQQEAEMKSLGVNAAIAGMTAVGGAFAGGSGATLSMGAMGTLANMGIQADLMAVNQQMSRDSIELQHKQALENAKYDIMSYQQKVNENKIGLLKANGIVAPTPYFTPEPNLAMYGYNKFVIYETKLQENDLKSLDDYFQRYGYNGIHRKLDQTCFTCRTYYTYVQAFDVNIKSSLKNFGLRIRQRAISQLNGGVRVWAVLPDAQYYAQN